MRETEERAAPWRRVPEGIMLRVRAVPRAARAEVAPPRAGVLVLRVTAPPVEGRANEACRELLAEVLGVAPGRVRLLTGERGREKVFLVAGLDEATLLRAMPFLAEGH